MTEPAVNDNKQAMAALKQHGEKIVWAIVAVLLAYFAWQFYQKNYAKIDTVAADAYTLIAERNDALMLGEQNPDLDAAAKEALAKEEQSLLADIDKLVAEHGDTVYAWQALMIKARHLSEHGDYAAAIDTVKQAQGIDLDDEGLAAIANVRLAQLLLANGDVDGALNTANTVLPQAFEASRQEVLGDVYVAKNELDNAKAAYESAWKVLSERGENRALLSLKMQALGMDVTPIETAQVVAEPMAVNADDIAALQTAEAQGAQAEEPAQDAGSDTESDTVSQP
ncbi:hypothetical protein B0181_03535 [Moraxella caviae]|uniref:Ancillary SecYEG translocon subunit n=1 Tax=Moraxella caviae TaxID=34060 RepID=A0A1T0A650_9GAMM|nr:tetratricopeptide repeat protein [Moraxella caviae]OOR91205.1 hypothetical protein B0181_03535 [Moraxella caviae]STZ13770.1 Uncharacterised protein [Moraxella caviae]VEW12661.1 Uncharacterised protein [Moraxella caviae]